MSTPKEVTETKKPSFIRSPLGLFTILASALVIIISILLIGHFCFDMFGFKTRSEGDDGTTDDSSTLHVDEDLVKLEKEYYEQKKILVSQINDAICVYNFQEFLDKTKLLSSLIKETFPGEDKQEPIFQSTDDVYVVRNAFADEAKKAAMILEDTVKKTDIKERYTFLEKMKMMREILAQTNFRDCTQFNKFIDREKFEVVFLYLKVKELCSSPGDEPIDDSSYLVGLKQYFATFPKAVIEGYPNCPAVRFYVQNLEHSTRICLVENLELEIEAIESKEEREKGIEKYSSFLRRISPNLCLRKETCKMNDDDFKALRKARKEYHSQKNQIEADIKKDINDLEYENFIQHFQNYEGLRSHFSDHLGTPCIAWK